MRARGQATVELALGALVLVTTLLLGLYLAEVSFLGLKVQEASAAAVWDATGRPMDDFAGGPAATRANYNRLLDHVKQQVGARYENFDALPGGANGTARVFTRGKSLEVRCEPTRGDAARRLSFNVPEVTRYDDGTATVPDGVNGQLRRWYQQRGATVCAASAVAVAYKLPRTFAEQSGGGFFDELREDQAIRLCGAGRAVGGQCLAGYPVLLGDWGLDGRPGSRIVRDSVLPESPRVVESEGNVPYRGMVRRLFRESGERYKADTDGYGPSAKLASKLAKQARPHNEKRFYMSYAGSEHDYGDMLEPQERIPPDCRNCHFNTAGTQTVNGNPELADKDDDWRKRRRPCFLGLVGCRVPN